MQVFIFRFLFILYHFNVSANFVICPSAVQQILFSFLSYSITSLFTFLTKGQRSSTFNGNYYIPIGYRSIATDEGVTSDTSRLFCVHSRNVFIWTKCSGQDAGKEDKCEANEFAIFVGDSRQM